MCSRPMQVRMGLSPTLPLLPGAPMTSAYTEDPEGRDGEDTPRQHLGQGSPGLSLIHCLQLSRACFTCSRTACLAC